MMLRSILLLLLVAGLAVSCTEENVDSTNEIELPNDPVEVEVNEVYLFTTVNSVTTEINTGDVRRADLESEGQIVSAYTVSSGPIECIEIAEGIFSAQSNFASVDYPHFWFNFFVNDLETALATLYYVGEFDGELREVVFFPQAYECGDFQLPEVTLTGVEADFIIGTIEGDLFTFNPDAPFPNPDDCNSWLSLGVNTIEFALPYTYCE